MKNCSKNNVEFSDCMERKIKFLNKIESSINMSFKLDYHFGTLITWQPLDRSDFLRLCRMFLGFDRCLETTSVQNICKNSTDIIFLNMLSYFCKQERRDGKNEYDGHFSSNRIFLEEIWG